MSNVTPNHEAEMSWAAALDLARQYHAKVVRPFARLEEVLRSAAGAESFAATVKAKLESEMAPLREEKALLETELAARRRAVEVELAAKRTAAEEPVKRALAELASLTAEADRQRGTNAELRAEESRLRERLQQLTSAITAAEAIR
jgi:hypothetical protein